MCIELCVYISRTIYTTLYSSVASQPAIYFNTVLSVRAVTSFNMKCASALISLFFLASVVHSLLFLLCTYFDIRSLLAICVSLFLISKDVRFFSRSPLVNTFWFCLYLTLVNGPCERVLIFSTSFPPTVYKYQPHSHPYSVFLLAWWLAVAMHCFTLLSILFWVSLYTHSLLSWWMVSTFRTHYPFPNCWNAMNHCFHSI